MIKKSFVVEFEFVAWSHFVFDASTELSHDDHSQNDLQRNATTHEEASHKDTSHNDIYNNCHKRRSSKR